MIRPDIFRYFTTSPEILRIAVMMSVRCQLSLRNVKDNRAENIHRRSDEENGPCYA